MSFRHRLSRWLPTTLRRHALTRLRVESLEDRATPATFVVDTGMDTTDPNDGKTSLREAITKLNMSADATNLIDIQTTETLTTMFNVNMPLITKNVVIQGKGAATTKFQGNLSRPFTIDGGAAPAIQVTITGLTTVNANAGGGGPMDTVFNKGGAIANLGDDKVTAIGVTFLDSLNATTGGAVFSAGGELTLQSCTFKGNLATDGGAVAATGGTVRVTASTFGGPAVADGNRATSLAGAITVENAVLTVTGSQFFNNKSLQNVGAIFISEDAGKTTTATITNSEFDNNTAVAGDAGAVGVNGTAEVTVTGSGFVGNSATGNGGGLAAISGALVTVVNSTFGGNLAQMNGGGVFISDAGTTLTLRSTTLGFNAANNGGGGLFVEPTANPAKVFNSLIGSSTGPNVTGMLDPTSNGNVIAMDAGLVGSAPAFNGGLTKTFAITATSPAKDAGSTDPGGLMFDQRGSPFLRLVGAKVDAGAYELQGVTRDILVTTEVDRFQPGVDPASLSLREALVQAGTDAVIRFDPALNGKTITLTLGELKIDRDGTKIAGPGADKLTISGNGASRVFAIDDGTNAILQTVEVSGLTLTKGNSTDRGGAVFSTENATFDGVVVRDSTTTANGGGIGVGGAGKFILRNSTVVANMAANGGGIEVANNGNATDLFQVINSTLSGNKAMTDGGGINIFPGAKLQVFNSTLFANLATTGKGGGISFSNGLAEVVGSIVAGNAANMMGADLAGTIKVNFSLVENPAGFTPAMGSSNIINGAAKLGPLANNGGSTLTHLPMADSPAVTHTFTDAQVNPLGLTTDQRGIPRKAGAVIDLGAAEFRMNTPPTIADLGARTTTIGTKLVVPVTVGDAETPDMLNVTATSDNLTLVPGTGLVLTGTGANRMLEITPAAGQMGTAVITVRVTDPDGAFMFRFFTLTVGGMAANTPPTLAAIPAQAVSSGATLNVPLTVGDAESLDALTITATSDNATLVPMAGLVVTGTGANRTLAVTPAANQTGTAMITVRVTDPQGAFVFQTFTLTVNPAGTNNPPSIADVPDQKAVAAGTTIGPITFTVNDAETAAGSLNVTTASSNTALVPATGIAIGGSGANRTVTVTPAAGQAGTAVITLTVTDAGGKSATDTFTVTFTGGGGGGAGTPVLVGFPQFGAGADRGSGSVQFLNPDKTVRFTIDPFGGFTGGVRTAAADFNGDGVADLVVGTGPGRPTRVMILDGKTQAQIFAIDPFETSFIGGVYVAAGDLTGDGVPDLVITPDEGGGPRCRVFSGVGFGQVADFFGIDDPNFRGGARPAIGDVNGDGAGDLVVAAGFLGGPRVATFSGKTLGSGPVKLFNDFFAFEQGLRNGVFITVGDLNGDGKAELIAGGGPGGGPRVTAFSSTDLISSGGGTLTQVANFFGGDANNRGGIRVAVKNLDNDNRADLVVGAGSGAGSRVTGYLGKDIQPQGTPPAVFDFDAFSGFAGGVFVG